MKAMIVVNLFEDFKPEILDEVFKLGSPVQSYVDSKDTWDSIKDSIAETISLNAEFIKSLRGPFRLSSGSESLFEDTVHVATSLEDLFNVQLDSITCFAGYGWKSISDLVDFYNGSVTIKVCNDPTKPNEYSPFDMALQIETQYDLRISDMDICFDTHTLPSAWLQRQIVDALSGHIGEVYIKHNGAFVTLDTRVLDVLSELKDTNAVACVEFKSALYGDNIKSIANYLDIVRNR